MAKLKRAMKLYKIDDCVYKSQTMVDAHTEFSKSEEVRTFHLPTVSDKARRSKYGSFKAMVNDIVFDSIMEARYYVYLLSQKKKGLIKDFERQVTYNLIPKFKDKLTDKTFLAINYIADFTITYPDDSVLIVDIKGKKTPEFRIKEKMFHYKYPELEFRCMQWDTHEKSWRPLDLIEKDARKRKREKKKNRKD